MAAGRVDDVINVSGHRIGTAEVEGALDSHPSVSEAAVVPVPHDIKGQGIYAFVSLMAVCPTCSLQHHLTKLVTSLCRVGLIHISAYVQALPTALPISVCSALLSSPLL